MNILNMITRGIGQAGLLLLSLVPFSDPVFAAEIPGYPANIHEYDPREIAMLPRYCIYTQSYRDTVPGGNNQSEIDRWYAVMGKAFHAMHHYCWGLMKTNRAIFLARNQRDRQFLLVDAIGEFDYVIRSAPPDFVLLPEIYTKKGENLIRLGRPEGIVELQRVVGLKPDYWPPYAALSDYFVQVKDLAKAQEWLEKGLAASPEATALLRRKAELNRGKGLPSVSVPEVRTQPSK